MIHPLSAVLGPFALACLVTLAPAQDVLSGASTGTRNATSFFFYSQQPFTAHGVVELTYGTPTWRAEYGAQLADAKPGTRVRLGSNFWTTFDSTVDFEFDGGEVKAGQHYLAIEVHADGELALLFLDAAQVRAKKWLAGATEETTGGVALPLLREDASPAAQTLSMRLVPNPKDTRQMTLVVEFGPIRASAVLYAKLEPAKTAKK